MHWQAIPLAIKQAVISLRHTLHQYPELSNHEQATQQRLLNALQTCRLRDYHCIGTSIVARLAGKNPDGAPIAIRGDIDALPITENTGLAWSSVNTGVMHACGHDVHAAWAIGAARLLSENPPESDVIVILQQAEELGTGAAFLMAQNAIPPETRAIFGGHVDRRYAIGEVVWHPGAISSYSDKLTIRCTGKSAHAARPHEGQNPIHMAHRMIDTIASWEGQHCGPTHFITITQCHAGSRHNIIPQTADLSGTIRCLCPQKRRIIHDALYALQEPGITVTITPSSPAVINHPGLESVAKQAIHNAVGIAPQSLPEPNMASEDFGHYTQSIPGWFFRVGARYPNDPYSPVHSPDFFAEDEAVLVGSAVLAEAVWQASAIR
jgi:amidohydrolase